MVELTAAEAQALRSQIAFSSQGGSRYAPFAFTGALRQRPGRNASGARGFGGNNGPVCAFSSPLLPI